MKKIFLSILFSTLFVFYAQNSIDSNFNKNYEEYTLENGMKVFVLEDFSTPLIRIEYAVKAGISAQSAANTGFFPLYTRLFKYGCQEESFTKNLTYSCNADTANYTITVTPGTTLKTLQFISKCAFAPDFSDKDIQKEYSELKNEVMQYALTPQAFINASIDSRIFSNAPWKQDSGIYPELFSKANPAKLRTILNSISKNYYSPQNSAIFINGALKKEDCYNFVEQTFGSYAKTHSLKTEETKIAGNKIKKFVLHDRNFSKDLTQVVVQYTSLDMNTCDLLSEVFDSNFSSIKTALCNEKSLNIRGAEYINAASTHKANSSRLIFQSLLENTKQSPVKQCELFYNLIKTAATNTQNEEFENAKKIISSQIPSLTSNSTIFMQNLSEFWSLQNQESALSTSLSEKQLSRPTEILKIQKEDAEKQFNCEEPFIFVLVNSKTFTKYSQEFLKNGYQEINSKNGSWYTQKLFENATNEVKSQKEQNEQSLKNELFSKQFINQTRNNTSTFTLSNGIPVTLVKNKNTSTCVLLLKIKGGKKADLGNSGFETVLSNALASNIQKEINRYQAKGLLESQVEVLSETLYSESIITIDCAKEDFSLCIKAASDALIFGEIEVAEADGYVYSVQTQKRMFNASPVNQLTNRAFSFLYNEKSITDIFDSEKDILQGTSYLEILSSYPALLNAARYEITAFGNINEEETKDSLEKYFSLLSAQKKQTALQPKTATPRFPEKAKKLSVKIRHLFYTDVKAEDAGPMPAILVPTKKFNDPVEYWFSSPNYEADESLFLEAAIIHLKTLFEQSGQDTKIFIPTKEFSVAGFIFLSVENISSLENLYKTVTQNLLEELSDSETAKKTLEDIKTSWALYSLKDCNTNRGRARLTSFGFENGIEKSRNYLSDYEKIENANAKDFENALKNAHIQEVPLSLYSSVAK